MGCPGGLKLFIDENLSPRLVQTAQTRGLDATCTRDRGKLGLPDHVLLQLCIDEDRVLVTENAGDFRALCNHAGLHPGLILLPCVGVAEQQRLLNLGLEHIDSSATAAAALPRDFIVNRVVEVDEDGAVTDAPLPEG